MVRKASLVSGANPPKLNFRGIMTANTDSRIDVALATYNGGPYIDEMLDSIAAQNHANLRVIISDDGSTDQTMAVVSAKAQTMPISVINGPGRKGVLRNFETALAASDAPYVALCDQDDFWMSEKLSTLLARLQALEATHGAQTPLLVFSDIEVVDSQLQTIKASMYDGSIKTKSARVFEDFFFSSHVPGCAMMFNRALLDIALPFPQVEIHDWWLIQVATLFGHVECVDRPLIKYRQHGNNAIGLGNPGKSSWSGRLQKLTRPMTFVRRRADKWHKQVKAIRMALKALEEQFGDQLPDNARSLVDAGYVAPNAGKLHRLLKSAHAGEWRPDYFGILYLLGRQPRS